MTTTMNDVMESKTHTTSNSKTMLWAGYVVSALPALFLLADGITKLVKPRSLWRPHCELDIRRALFSAWRFCNSSAAMAAGRAYGEALQAAGVFVAGAGLESPQKATTVRLRDGKRQVHDGPFAETKEFLGGFGIIDVPDLETALDWAARHPAAAFAAIEVRPLFGSRFLVGEKP
jgi:hypothetical protein